MRSDPDADRFLRSREVQQITGLSRTTIWRLERDGQFPRRRRLTPYTVGWLWSEISAWMAERTKIGEVAAA